MPTTTPPSPGDHVPTGRAPTSHNRQFGAWGEGVAARHLSRMGMVVLDRNWRCDAGEIDLVLREADVLVICEVKTRTSVAFGSPLEAVDPRKARRLQQLGYRWLREHAARPVDVRVDLVGILAPKGGPVDIEHVRGIG